MKLKFLEWQLFLCYRKIGIFNFSAKSLSFKAENMSLNGPLKMYKIRPLYDFSPAISLPTSMYKMKNLYEDDTSPSEYISEDDLKLLEIEKHQLNILQKLEDLKDKVLKMKEELNVPCGNKLCLAVEDKFQDIVVKANPEYPPLSLWVFHKLLSQTVPTQLVTFIHSSLTNIPEYIQQLQNISCPESCKVSLTLIWRDGKGDHEMMIDPVNQGMIEGEVNIARYIARILKFNYDVDPVLSTQIDNWLETAHSLIIHGNAKDRQAALKSLNTHLGKNGYLVQNNVSLADIIVWSALIQTKLHLNLPANVSQWFELLMESDLFDCGKNLPFL